MLSLSDNEFSVISFLTRNSSERLTIRNIAKRLGFSAAGVFNILKKLEKEGIVVGERLGTGLFYYMNFESKVAEHLSAVTLVYSEDKIDGKIADAVRKFKVAIFDKKTLLVLGDGISDISVEGVNVIYKSEEELITCFRKKDPEVLAVLKRGTALCGEMKLVEIIKNSMSRF